MRCTSTVTPLQLDDLIEQSAIEATLGLFRTGVAPLQYSDGIDGTIVPGVAPSGIVGFVGRQMCGTLLLTATKETLILSNGTSASSRDWMAELSNQLFGRLKNRLLRRGFELSGSTPAVIEGDHLAALTRRQERRPIVLRGDGGARVCVWIDYSVEVALPISLSDGEGDEDIPLEGTILLF
jgi:hypothetical protein